MLKEKPDRHSDSQAFLMAKSAIFRTEAVRGISPRITAPF